MEPPQPVVLGEPISEDPLAEQLHRATLANRPRRIRRCLARGCSADATNAAGQTALFAAAFTARRAAADELLRRGASPNARCDGGYTAVHAACFAGRCRLLRRLLESGGDLRLYDLAGRRPADWARLQPDPLRRRRVLQLIESARLAAMTSSGRDALVERNTSFSGGGGGGVRTLLRRLLPGETPHRRAAAGYDEVDMAELVRSVQSVGFGAVYYGGGETKPAAMAVLPMVSERALEPDRSARGYALGAYTEMTSRLYLGTPVSVRRLMERPPVGAHRDLLIAELEAARQLHHPNLLLLMAVCPSENLDGVALVFERVSLGSLHHCRYRRGPRLSARDLADVLLQVCSALRFLHAARWLHCAVTSHAVQLLSPTRAKLACLEHAVSLQPSVPVRPQRRLLACRADGALYNWLAPEVLSEGVPTEAADVYSFCALTWEVVHGRPPWAGMTAQEICKQMGAGRRLPLNSEVCPTVLRNLLEVGLQPEPQSRDLQLEEASFMLTNYRDGLAKNKSRPTAPPPATAATQTKAEAANSRTGTPTCRPATPGSSSSLLRRSTKGPAPPVPLSRTLSPEALAPSQRVSLREQPRPAARATSERQTTPAPPAPAEDPFTGLRRTVSGRHRRSSTWQSATAGVAVSPRTDEEVAIKPASHRLTRHGSSCSINRRPVASGASPWPPADGEVRRLHSLSLDGQAPRCPRFSPSPPGSVSLSQLMAELDICDLVPGGQTPGPQVPRRSLAPAQERRCLPRHPDSAAPAAPSEHHRSLPRVLSDCPADAAPAAPSQRRRSLPRVLPDHPGGAASGRAAPQGPPLSLQAARSDGRAPPLSSARPFSRGRLTRSLPRPAPLVSDSSGISRATSAARWPRRETPGQTSATMTETASQTTSMTDERSSQTTGSRAGDSHGASGRRTDVTGTKRSSSGPGGGTELAGHRSGTLPSRGARCTASNGHDFTQSRRPVAYGRQVSVSSEETTAAPVSHGGTSRSTGADPSTTTTSSSGGQPERPQTLTISSDEQMAAYSRSSFAARRQFFSGGAASAVGSSSSNGGTATGSSSSGGAATGSNGDTVQSQSDSAIRLPQKLNPALLLSREPEAERRRLLLTQPRPFQPAAGAQAAPQRVSYPTFQRALVSETGRAGDSSSPQSAQQGTQSVESSASPHTPPAAAATSTPQRQRAPEPAAATAAGTSSSSSAAAAAGHRLNVTFHAQVLEFSAPEGSGSEEPPPEEPEPEPEWPPPPTVEEAEADYYDDDLSSPDVQQAHLQLQPVVEPVSPLPPLQPVPYLQCLDDDGRASPLSMELPSSAAESELDEPELQPLHISEEELSQPTPAEELPQPISDSDSNGSQSQLQNGDGEVANGGVTSAAQVRADGSRVRLFEVACERGFSACVETSATADGQCTVTCTSTDLRDGSETTYQRTVQADEVQTQIVVADR